MTGAATLNRSPIAMFAARNEEVWQALTFPPSHTLGRLSGADRP